ncbi:MAG: ATP-binding protein [Bacteroidota bacterium]
MTTKSTTLTQPLWTSSTVGLGIINDQRRLTEVNPAFCAIYGYERIELLGRSIDQLIPQHFRAKARLHYQNYVHGDASKGLQFINKKNGEQRYVQISTDEITTDSGEPGQLITIIALPHPPPRTELPVTNHTSLPGVFWFECDAQGLCLHSNSLAQQKLGIHPNQMLLQPVAIYSGLIQRMVSIAELLNERPEWENAEWQMNPEGDYPHWMLANTHLTERKTKVVCLVSLTDQKRLEDALTKTLQSLRASNEHLQHFLQGATHDLKAPLASLLGLIDIFQDEDDEAEKEMYLQLMEKSIHRLNEFVHEIVDYSKRKHRGLLRETVDFHVLVNDAFEHLEYSTNVVEIEKIVDIHQKAPFYSDPHTIKVILNNLISNAYKYSSTHRRRGEIRVSVFASEKEATLQVSDNGLGIAREHLDNIFDMFYRASVKQEGSGLGLYLVKEAVNKMKGRIHVDSTLGEGTIFTVLLPAVAPVPKQEQMSLPLQ